MSSCRRYGLFLTNAEVNELVKPSADSVDRVMAWLGDASDVATSPNSDFIRATVTIAQVLLSRIYSSARSLTLTLTLTPRYSTT